MTEVELHLQQCLKANREECSEVNIMSSTESAAKSAAERNANRHSTIQSLKTWHAEFNGVKAGNAKSALGESSSNTPPETVSPASKPLSELKSILKGQNKGDTPKRTISFTVDEESIARRERLNLFQDYGLYFTLNAHINGIKKTAVNPGFYLYLDKDFKICVLVVHKKGENETIHLSLIVETDKDKSLHQELAAMLCEEQFRLLQMSDITNPEKILVNEIFLKDSMRDLILVNCKGYFTKTPLSHREMHPVHVFLFSKSEKAKVFAENYFFEEDIRDSFVFDDDSHDAGDAYIVFRDPILSEEHKSQLIKAKEKDYKIIEVLVQEEALDVDRVIDDILKLYAIEREDFFVSWFKKEVAARAKRITKEAIASKEEFEERIKIKVSREIAEESIAVRAKILAARAVYSKEEDENRAQQMVAEGKSEQKIEEEIERETQNLKNRCVSIYEKMILSDLVRIYIIANLEPRRSRKQSFLNAIYSYCNRMFNRAIAMYEGEGDRAEIIDAEERDFKETVKEIIEIYISSYNGYHVQLVSAQEPIASSEMSQVAVKPISIQEPVVFHDGIKPEVKVEESSEISALKELVSGMANRMFSEAKDLEFKQAMEEKFAKMYAVIEACPDVALGYYETYRRNLKKIEESIQSKKKAHFSKFSRSSLMGFDEIVQEEAKLEKAMQTEKNKAFEDLISDLIQNYPIYCADAPKPVEVSHEHSSKEEERISIEEEIQAVLEIEERNIPIDTVVKIESDEVEDSGGVKKPESITFFRAESQREVIKPSLIDQVVSATAGSFGM